MSDTTARLGLYRPDDNGAENINVTTDLNNNWSKLDSQIGAFPCTSGNRPSSPYDGMFIRETDTGKLQLWNATAGAWQQVLFHTATFGQAIDTSGNVTAGGFFRSTRASGGAFAARTTGDTDDRVLVGVDGTIKLGSGAGAQDVTVYRDGAGMMGVTGLISDTDIIAGDTVYTSGLEIGNDEFVLGSVKKRSQLSALSAVANTTAETALCVRNIPANDAVVGAVYKIKAWGDLSVAAATSPTMTLRARIGGVGGVGTAFGAVTIRSGASAASWEAEFFATCTAIGGSGNFNLMFKAQHNWVTNATTYTILGPHVAGATRDTTASQDMVITAQWSAASSSNVINCTGIVGERVL